MLRIGPITIMSSKTHDSYRAVVTAAWLVHQTIWFFGESGTEILPKGLSGLIDEDAALSKALSYVPAEDAPT